MTDGSRPRARTREILFGPAILVLLSLCACASTPDRVALVVANGDYAHAAPLPNPKSDATAIAQTLVRAGWKVQLALDQPRSELVALVSQMSQELDAAERVLLYYAGHGMQIDGRNYLVPIDFDPNGRVASLAEDLFPLDQVIGALKRPDNQLAVLLDACRDNPLADRLQQQLSSSLARGLRIEGAEGSELRFDRGLAEVKTEAGTFIAFATEPGNVALDGAGEHSPFVEGLLRHLATPNRDLGWILKRVRSDVIRLTGGAQVPWDHSSLTEDFQILQSRPSAPPP